MTSKISPIFALLAPTASGKTELAIALAKTFPIEIVNADTYQFYRMMDIGTAKPSLSQRAEAPHHLYDTLNPDEGYSAHQFAKHARHICNAIQDRGHIPLLVGGSGFYLRAFMTPVSKAPKGTADIQDVKHAYQEVIRKDPDLAKDLHPHDGYRIARATFLIDHGYLPSKLWAKEKSSLKNHLNVFVMTVSHPREKLYERINLRVVQMMKEGLQQETHAILQSFPKARTRLSKTIGYREMLDHVEGKLDETTLVEKIQQKTRHYAKRQMTWIRNQLHPHTTDFENAFEDLSCYMSDIIGETP